MYKGRFLLGAALAGAALFLSMVPRPIPLLVFVFPAALYAALSPRDGEVVGFGKALLVGVVSGTVASLGAMYWMPSVFVSFAGFPTAAAWAVGALVFLWHSGPFVFATVTTSIVARRGGRPDWVVLPAALAVGFGVMPTLFPWRPTVCALPILPYVQLVELGGQPLVDFLIGLVGCGAFVAHRRRAALREASFRVPALVAWAAFVLPIGYGLVRIHTVENERAKGDLVRVGVVQPNVGIEMKHDPARADEILARLQRLTARAQESGIDLALWPETSYPRPFPRAIRTDLPGRASVVGEAVRAPLVFGAITAVGSGCDRWNSALALEDGRIKGVVDKVRLVPFSEFVPLWRYSPAIRAVVPCPGFRLGIGEPVLEVAGVRLGVFNCFEDILSSRGFRVGRESPDLLVNLTNDAWFGDTTEPYLHHQAARLRSIETRRDLVRAVNTGVSGLVSATGADLFHTETFVETVFVAEARTMSGTTPFVLLGDWITLPLAIFLVLPLLRRLRAAVARRRARQPA